METLKGVKDAAHKAHHDVLLICCLFCVLCFICSLFCYVCLISGCSHLVSHLQKEGELGPEDLVHREELEGLSTCVFVLFVCLFVCLVVLKFVSVLIV